MQIIFNEGDYIVPLTDDADNNNWNGWVLKQRCDDKRVKPVIDPNTRERGNTWFADVNPEEGIDWRYATPSEIQEYDKFDWPCKVEDIQSTQHYEIF